MKDSAKSFAFYRDGFGLLTKSGIEGDIAFFNRKGLGLLYFPKTNSKDGNVPNDGQGFPGFSFGHLVNTREDVDRMINNAVKAGAVICNLRAFAYVFSVKLRSITLGIPTAYSASVLSRYVISTENVVWSYPEGSMKGQAVPPL